MAARPAKQAEETINWDQWISQKFNEDMDMSTAGLEHSSIITFFSQSLEYLDGIETPPSFKVSFQQFFLPSLGSLDDYGPVTT